MSAIIFLKRKAEGLKYIISAAGCSSSWLEQA
jgi:hypothetical protein